MNHTLVCIDVYTVAAGDTLYSIAEKYDLPVSLLMRVNQIPDPYQLAVGTKLCIPGDASQLPAYPHPSKPPQKPRVHVIEPGDTFYLIAKKYNLKLDDLMEVNPEMNPYQLTIGATIRLPK